LSNTPSVNARSEILSEVDDFFMSQGPVQKTMYTIAQRLARAHIEYAVIGGMALALHGFVRPTQDVDLLLTREGLEHFQKQLVGPGYTPLFGGAQKHFRDTETGVKVEFITAGEYPGDGKAKPVVFPDPEDAAVTIDELRVVNLVTLIELKLASGLSADHRKLRDLADVQQLIERLKLPEDLSAQLDESVRNEFLRLWRLAQKARREEAESDWRQSNDKG
jgi:Uncharacterised nucleotidyltransferase